MARERAGPVVRWVRRILAVVGVIIVVGMGMSWALGGVLTRTYPRSIGEPPPGMQVESVELPGRWGKLSGWRVGEVTGRGCVLLLHGIGADRRSMISRARMLDGAGYGVFLIDQQGHGQSEGDAVAFGARSRWDAMTAVTAMRGWGCSRVAVLGVSMGGAAAVLAGSRLEADAVVVEQVYGRLDEAATARFRQHVGPLAPWITELLMIQLGPRLGLTPAQVRPAERISDLEAPTLIIAGSEDWRAPPQAAEQMAEAAGGPTELWIVEGAGHESLHQRLGEDYEQRILQFLSRWMTPSS